MLQLLLNAHNETTDDVDEGAGPQLTSKGKKRALTHDEVTAQVIKIQVEETGAKELQDESPLKIWT